MTTPSIVHITLRQSSGPVGRAVTSIDGTLHVGPYERDAVSIRGLSDEQRSQVIAAVEIMAYACAEAARKQLQHSLREALGIEAAASDEGGDL